MPFCTSCGERSSGAGRFCTGCGKALQTDVGTAALTGEDTNRPSGPQLLEPAIEFNAILHSPDGRPMAGVLTIAPDGITFAVGSRIAARDPYGMTAVGWQWSDVAQMDFADAGSSRMRFFGGGERAAHLTVTQRAGAPTVLEIHYEAYVEVEEAAFCVAAATDTLVTLDGFAVSAEEAADELEGMLDDDVRPGATYGEVPSMHPSAYASGYPAMPAPTNGLAIASLVCAFVFTPLGLVFGLIAKSQIKRTGESGGGLATAGIVISIIFMALVIAAWIAFTVAISHPQNV